MNVKHDTYGNSLPFLVVKGHSTIVGNQTSWVTGLTLSTICGADLDRRNDLLEVNEVWVTLPEPYSIHSAYFYLVLS